MPSKITLFAVYTQPLGLRDIWYQRARNWKSVRQSFELNVCLARTFWESCSLVFKNMPVQVPSRQLFLSYGESSETIQWVHVMVLRIIKRYAACDLGRCLFTQLWVNTSSCVAHDRAGWVQSKRSGTGIFITNNIFRVLLWRCWWIYLCYDLKKPTSHSPWLARTGRIFVITIR